MLRGQRLERLSSKLARNIFWIEIRVPDGYFSLVRGLLLGLLVVCWCAPIASISAATGRVIKVLPHFVDLAGRRALSPSLYDRDAYQVFLRDHPEKRSGMRFDIHWKAKPGPDLKLRLELRGIAQGDLPRQLTVEEPVRPGKWFSRWSHLDLVGDAYASFGTVTAWRVSLVEDGRVVGEQKSFLW